MSDCLNEQLSALLDGELPAGEAELLLRRLDRDPVLRERLGRYSLIGDALRVTRLEAGAVVEGVASGGFAARISAAIETEERQAAVVALGQGLASHGNRLAETSAVAARPRRRAASRWWRPLGGMTVAAGVAGLAFVALQRAPMSASPAVLTAAAPAAVERVTAMAPLPGAVVDPLAAAQPVTGALAVAGEPVSYTTPGSPAGPSPTFIPATELAGYVVAHSEVSGPLARHNVLSGVVVEPMPEPGRP